MQRVSPRASLVGLALAGGLFSVMLAALLGAAVLGYRSPVHAANPTANRVFGQAGFTSNGCNSASASSLCGPGETATDGSGRLYIVDELNNRVLEYDSPLTSQTANHVFGQGGSFTANACNNGGVTAASLCGPGGVAVDSVGHLYIADRGNHRVLEYDSPLVTSPTANHVFGQAGSFNSNTANNGGIGSGSLCAPDGIAVDSAGGLYVAESLHVGLCSNNRVLEYDSPLTTDTVADRVFGQGGSFASSACASGSGGLCNPDDVAVDSGRLYVADINNNRVLEYDSPLASQTADRVFGQGASFTANACNNGGVSASASSLCAPQGVAVDSASRLYVADTGNNRVLKYDTPLTNQAANQVFGQGGSLTLRACNNGGISPSANSLCSPYFVSVDGAGRLYVSDRGNNRVLEYDTPVTKGPTFTPTPTPTITPTPCPSGKVPAGSGCGTPTPTFTPTPTRTPGPVGGIAKLPDVAGTQLDQSAPRSGGVNLGLYVSVAAAAAMALAGGIWFARRQGAHR